MKLELKHITPYSAYGLKGMFLDSHDILASIDFDFKTVGSLNSGNCKLKNFKPALRPLSDITKEIETKRHGKTTMASYISCSKKETKEYIQYGIDCETLEYWQFERLIQYHFDVFGLIKEGLAIDINTINK